MTTRRAISLLATLLLTGALAACAGPRAAREAPPVSLVGATPRPAAGAITVGGRERTYLLHLPPAGAARPLPLVLAFHGTGGQGASMAGLTGFDALADRYGFAVAYPDGLDRHWNDGRGDRRALADPADDVAFVRALIDQLAATQPIDPARVYATGMSNGAIFAQRLACDLADRIVAIGAVAGSLPEAVAPGCAPARPVPVLMIMGEADPFVPWAGGLVRGVGAGPVLSVADTVAHWVRQNGCAATPSIAPEPDRAPDDGTTVRREAYGGCRAGADVVLYAVANGGHAWPGGPQYLPEETVGKSSRDIAASALIWGFFAARPQAQPRSSSLSSPLPSPFLLQPRLGVLGVFLASLAVPVSSSRLTPYASRLTLQLDPDAPGAWGE